MHSTVGISRLQAGEDVKPSSIAIRFASPGGRLLFGYHALTEPDAERRGRSLS
jgi:hypothetical protein